MKGGARPGGMDHKKYDVNVEKNMDEPFNYDKLSKEAREYMDDQHRKKREKPNYKMTCDICKTKELIPIIRGIGGIDTQGLSICDFCYSSDKIKRKSSRKKFDGETISKPSDFPYEDLYETFISEYHDIASLKSKRKKKKKSNKKKKSKRKKKQTKRRRR